MDNPVFSESNSSVSLDIIFVWNYYFILLIDILFV